MSRAKPVRRSSVLSAGCLLFLVGLGFARVGPRIPGLWCWLGLIPVVVMAVFDKRRRLLLIAVSVSCFLLGWYRGQSILVQTKMYDQLVSKTVTIQGVVIDDAVYSDRGQLEFAIGSMRLDGQRLVGEMDVEGSGVPMIYRGDEVRVTGRLFKKRGGQIVGTSFAKLAVVSRSHSPIDTVRRNFAAGLQNVLPEQLAAFGLGLLIGQRTTLDKTLSDELITVGLIHIVAVSGYNLTVIIEVVRRLFRRRSRYQSLVFSVGLIGIFLLFTGFSPSIVRAAIVSSISLTAWYFGRVFKPVLLLLLVAALTAGVNPLYLWSNIGWWLSFTAFFGVLVLGPLMKERFVPVQWQEHIVPSVLSETISAQVCTIPVILYIFGRLSLISILANVLVVPLTPLAMLLSLVAGLAGMSNLFFSRLAVLPGRIILEYMLSISSLLAHVPYANIEVHINGFQMICLYALVLGFVGLLRMKVRRRSDILTEIEEQHSYVRTQQVVNN